MADYKAIMTLALAGHSYSEIVAAVGCSRREIAAVKKTITAYGITAGQASSMGLADRFEEVEEAYAGADRVLGRLIKVTPSSKVVGDLALTLVGQGITAGEFAQNPADYDIPDSVIGFLSGELGDPVGGWPEPLRSTALAGRAPTQETAPLTAEDHAALDTRGPERRRRLNTLLFPQPAAEFEDHCAKYGDTSRISSNQFFYGLRNRDEHRVRLEQGVELLIGLEAIGEVDDNGYRTVMCILNGQLRPVQVRDRSVAVDVPTAEKADPANDRHVAAPFSGVVTVVVSPGELVDPGATVATIEAMKMEAAITSPRGGTVTRVALADISQVEAGDLIVEVDGGARDS